MNALREGFKGTNLMVDTYEVIFYTASCVVTITHYEPYLVATLQRDLVGKNKKGSQPQPNNKLVQTT